MVKNYLAGTPSFFSKNKEKDEEDSFLENFKEIVKERVAQSFWNILTLNWYNILDKLEKKHKEYGHFEPADIWGALLTDRLLGDLPSKEQNFTFADIRTYLQKIDTESYPLFSTCIKNCPPITQDYCWFEVNPYTSGSDELKGFIPTEYLGSFFDDGKLMDQLPEEELSFLMGLFGSAYNFNIGDILLLLAQGLPEDFTFEDLYTTLNQKIPKENTLDKLLLLLGDLIPEKYTCKNKIINSILGSVDFSKL